MNTIVHVLNIWTSPGHDFAGRFGKGRLNHGLESKESINCAAGKGIEGDRYYDHKENYKGQITFFSEEIAKGLEEALSIEQLDRSATRRNVLVSGIDLNSLVGKRFKLGNLILSGSEECAPCAWMDEVLAPGAHQWLKGNGGLRCRIETSGTLETGEQTLELL